MFALLILIKTMKYSRGKKKKDFFFNLTRG